MSAWVPVGSACEDGTAKADGGPGATAVSGGAEWSIDAAQQAHVHRTQDAGQPLSGADSLVPIGARLRHQERRDDARVRHEHGDEQRAAHASQYISRCPE